MEKVAGAAIFIIGVLLITFGRAPRHHTDRQPIAGPMATGKVTHRPSTSSRRLPPWLDITLQWGSGILSLWFGVQLFFGHAHFF